MINDGNAGAVTDFKDRSTGLVVFGVILILLGVLTAFIALLMGAVMLASDPAAGSSAPQADVRTQFPALVFYVAMAVWFIWMGIGSIKARRWARALVLVSSWMWLVVGLMATAVMLVFMPEMCEQMRSSGKMSEEAIAVVKFMSTIFVFLIFVLIPGVFILFYGSRHVKATCEKLDEQVRWTDKCPLPVLGMSLVSGLWALCMPSMGLHGWAFPFFGIILSGNAGALLAFVTMLLLVYVACGTYCLDIRAWWCAVLMVITWGASVIISFSRVNFMELYEKMNYSVQEMEAIKQFAMAGDSRMSVFSGLWAVIMLTYLLYTRRFFVRPAEQNSISRTGRM